MRIKSLVLLLILTIAVGAQSQVVSGAQDTRALTVVVEHLTLKEGGELVDGKMVPVRSSVGDECQYGGGSPSPAPAQIIVRDGGDAIIAVADVAVSTFTEHETRDLWLACRAITNIEVPEAAFYSIHIDDQWVRAIAGESDGLEVVEIVVGE
jgi:hypothetical protein